MTFISATYYSRTYKYDTAENVQGFIDLMCDLGFKYRDSCDTQEITFVSVEE